MLVYINFNNHKFSVSLRFTLYVYIEGHFTNTRVLIVGVDMMKHISNSRTRKLETQRSRFYVRNH